MALIREWRPVIVGGNGPAISTSLSEDEAAKLAELAAGKTVMEIGSAYGYSAVVMAVAGGQVVAIDPHSWLPSFGPMTENLAAYGVEDRVTIIMDGAENAVPMLEDRGLRFDLVWIDGDHSQQAVERDVRLALTVLAPGGVLACHDYDEISCPGVRPGLEAMVGNPHELIGTLAIYRGLR